MIILYYIASIFIWFVSILPFRILYFFSDITFFFLYYVLQYRKSVVFNNLNTSFPEKNMTEIKSIAKKFYRHLSDIIYENIKMNHMGLDELSKRISYTSTDILDEYYKQNKHVLVAMAHYCNWEWLLGLSKHTKHQGYTLNKPLKNKYFDRYFLKTRKKFNVHIVHMRRIVPVLKKCIEENKLSITTFIADQSPVFEHVQHWITFLNQETAVHLGIEKVAKKFNLPVVFLRIYKINRGFYKVEVMKVADDPSKTKDHEITNKHLALLEETIRMKPEWWLWTHKRWKYNKQKETII